MENKHWTEVFQWHITPDPDIFKCVGTGKFHFADETERIDPIPYDTFEDAIAGLTAYCKEMLW